MFHGPEAYVLASGSLAGRNSRREKVNVLPPNASIAIDRWHATPITIAGHN
jgi:hypothetical protein